jgi:acyl-CoA thioester hydrolase
MNEKILTDRYDINVRFGETDAMGVVWHGNYLKFFEDGRESFGRSYGLKYLWIFENGFYTPIVSIKCDYKKPLYYGEDAYVITRYRDCEAAKIQFEYEIHRSSDDVILAIGESLQVFITHEHELILTSPQFFLEWKKKYLG